MQCQFFCAAFIAQFLQNVSTLHQRMFFLCQLKKFTVNKTILTQFYRAVIESVLTFSIIEWFGSASIHNKNMLEGTVKTTSKITGSKLASVLPVIFGGGEGAEREKGYSRTTSKIVYTTHHHSYSFLALVLW